MGQLHLHIYMLEWTSHVTEFKPLDYSVANPCALFQVNSVAKESWHRWCQFGLYIMPSPKHKCKISMLSFLLPASQLFPFVGSVVTIKSRNSF